MDFRKKYFSYLVFLAVLGTLAFGGYIVQKRFSRSLEYTTIKNTIIPPPTPIINYQNPPVTKVLSNDYQIFETFNNCGPASLSMDLSYFGIYKTQQELGQELRPYQNPQGDNDDKSVSLDEMAAKAEEFGLLAYHRPNGNIDLLKKFIANGIPVITQTNLHENDDIGHFRIVRGYDDQKKELIQDDSFQGHNIHFSYDIFEKIWKPYANEYLVLVPKNQGELVKEILGDDFDENHAWQQTVTMLENDLKQNPNDVVNEFNLSVAYYRIGEYQKSVNAFEKVQNKLSFRTLWYNIEPIEAYYQLGQYNKVFAITDNILNHGNRAFSELYILRGNMYKRQGQNDKAKAEFEKAVLYNKNMKEAQDALTSVSG